MENSLFIKFDLYFFTVLGLHTVISFVIAFFLSRYVTKRFIVSSYKVNKEDIYRLQEIMDKNKFYKFLFRFSLHKNNFRSSMMYFFLFNFAMPFLGYIFSILLARQMINAEYAEKISNTNLLNLDELGISFLEVERVFGEGSLNELIHSKYAPKSKKLRALNVLSTNISPANLRIIKQTLSSTDDEIRMFGYSIIDKAEKRLAKNINTQIENLKDADSRSDSKDAAKSAKKLAFLYWEMLYTELSHESLHEEFLEQVERYALLSRRHYLFSLNKLNNKDKLEHAEINIELSKLHLLLGKVYMREKLYDNAITEFITAQELRGDDTDFAVPYIAEVYFLTGKYKIVGSILSKVETLGINSTIYPIVEQWKRA
jgi:polysaccharide biosynthesis protein PelE